MMDFKHWKIFMLLLTCRWAARCSRNCSQGTSNIRPPFCVKLFCHHLSYERSQSSVPTFLLLCQGYQSPICKGQAGRWFEGMLVGCWEMAASKPLWAAWGWEGSWLESFHECVCNRFLRWVLQDFRAPDPRMEIYPWTVPTRSYQNCRHLFWASVQLPTMPRGSWRLDCLESSSSLRPLALNDLSPTTVQNQPPLQRFYSPEDSQVLSLCGQSALIFDTPHLWIMHGFNECSHETPLAASLAILSFRVISIVPW